MSVVRLMALGALLAASFQAAAYDAARCSETRQAIAKLEANLSRGPTAQDRLAFERALSVYRTVEPEFCGSGPGLSAGGAPPASTAAALQSAIGALQALSGALSPDAGAAGNPPGDARTELPAPPVPSGSVTGPMSMQRLPSPGQTSGVAAGSLLPRVSQPTATVLQPGARAPDASAAAPTVGQPDVSVHAPAVAQPTVTARAPAMQALEQAAASPFPTDQEIALACSTAANPSFCELSRETQRNQDPAYRRWKSEQDALRERNIERAMANVDAAIAAAHAPGSPSVRPTIPVNPPQVPYDNSDPDLAKCREGEKAPWTIAGCYDLSGGLPANKAEPREALRDRLRKSLEGEDQPEAEPSRDPAAEARFVEQWRQSAEKRLSAAIAVGKAVVPENISARAACEGTWMYDGLSAGTCYADAPKRVFAVNVPAPTRQAAAAASREDEPFSMDAKDTEKEIRRLLGTQPVEQYGPPAPADSHN